MNSKRIRTLKVGKSSSGPIAYWITGKLGSYFTLRNDTTKNGVSNLSPYLHFGQISALRVELEVKKAKADLETKEASLDELLVRKELEDNFCRYNLFYENFDSFPEWARKTLNSHRHDQRNYVYILEELEAEDT